MLPGVSHILTHLANPLDNCPTHLAVLTLSTAPLTRGEAMPDTSTESPTKGLEVGQFFVSHWGYDQTNVDFYRIEKITAKMVLLRPWGTRTTPQGRVVPGDVGSARTFRAKVSPGWSGEGYWVNLTSYSGASLWDGEPEYDTIKAGEAGH